MAKRSAEADRARQAAKDYYNELAPDIRAAVVFVHVRLSYSGSECTIGVSGGVYLPAGYLFFPENLGDI